MLLNRNQLSDRFKQNSVLASSTFAFTMCFMVWTMFSVIAIPIRDELGLSEFQFGLLTAMPVLSGSLIRIPLGMMTDRFGGRKVFLWLLAISIVPIYLIQSVSNYYALLAIGLLMGLAGGSFSVGTPYVSKWFPPHRKGLAMGVFGAVNMGSSLNTLIAPSIIALGSWHLVPKVYALMITFTFLVFLIFSFHDESHISREGSSLKNQIRLLRDPKVLCYSQLYSVVFGGYVGLALWLTSYYRAEFALPLTVAGVLAACFSMPGGVLRAFGGWLSDKFGAYRVTAAVLWVCFISFFILSYPKTDFIVETIRGDLSLHISLNVYFFTAILFLVGVAMAVGKASVFKFISDEYEENIGAVSGIVGLAGGLGGFLLPILFGFALDLTGIRSSCFMLLFGTTCVSLIYLAWSRKTLNED